MKSGIVELRLVETCLQDFLSKSEQCGVLQQKNSKENESDKRACAKCIRMRTGHSAHSNTKRLELPILRNELHHDIREALGSCTRPSVSNCGKKRLLSNHLHHLDMHNMETNVSIRMTKSRVVANFAIHGLIATIHVLPQR